MARTEEQETLLALFKIVSVLKGAELCDRCGETIWPEIELVRCDFCVWKYGPPDVAEVREAEKRNWQRIRHYEREMAEQWIEEME